MSLFAGGRTRAWRYSASGQWFNIDGYIPVATEQDLGIAPRGPIDSLLGSTHTSGFASAGYQAANGWRLDVVANVVDEDRTNGTPQSINSTAWRQGSGEIAGALAGGLLGARCFGGTQRYRQVFTTVNATRTAETLIRDQNVPSTSGGLGGQWSRSWGSHTLLAGTETPTLNEFYRNISAGNTQTRPNGTLYRLSSQAESRLACLGHLLIENRHSLIADAMATIAEGFGEPEAATLMMLKSCCMVDDWD